MPKFNTRRDQAAAVESPESVFRSLRPTDGEVRHLWAHQADLLRDYQKIGATSQNVAVELPTGAGKTLVGQLLGEYRRRALSQRVAYLCPTIQLARQAKIKADAYGIPAVLLVGKQRDYARADLTSFNRGQTLAISTYWGVFNNNPALEAQTLILDDAHAGEGAVAGMWSVEADRNDPLYKALVPAFLDSLPDAFAERLRRDDPDPFRRRAVELVPPTVIFERADLLRDALDEHATDSNRYAATMLGDRIEHSLCFISGEQVLLRPLVAPTAAHAPFAAAEQRIYMSATLGSGGELERIFGVEEIVRLAVPAGWDEHGSGRRFFLFPGAARGDAGVDAFVYAAVKESGKALVLGPSAHEAESLASLAPDDVSVIYTREAERDLGTFVEADEGAVFLANRYDGIDLPDDACRLTVLSGLPAATHLQERFLYETLGATRVLTERIRSRVVQGAGRCTRNTKDYAAVIVRGARLTDFLARDENLRAMHPELQAEIAFGFDQSDDPSADLLDLLRSFLKQDEDWSVADSDIEARTAQLVRTVGHEMEELEAAAKHEVACWSALWQGDVEKAIDHALSVVDRIARVPGLNSYRALWAYLAASWATTLATESRDAGQERAAEKLRNAAEGAGRSARWRRPIALSGSHGPPTTDFDSRAARAAETLYGLGIRGLGFEKQVAEIEAQIASDEATPFELGLESVGRLLGFESVRPNAVADPDGAWRDDERDWLLFEAKTEEKAANPLSVGEVRQAGTHRDWVKNNLLWEQPARALTCIVAYKGTIDKTAASLAGDLVLVDPSVLRSIAESIIELHRELRPKARSYSQEELEAAFSEGFQERGLSSGELWATLSKSRLVDLPTTR